MTAQPIAIAATIPQYRAWLSTTQPLCLRHRCRGNSIYCDNTTGAYWGTSNNTSGGSALQYIPEIVWNDTSNPNILYNGAYGMALRPAVVVPVST